MKKIMIYSLLSPLMFIYCRDQHDINIFNKVKYDHVQINNHSFQKFSDYTFIIFFSNLIYQEKETQIKIPIFQGTKEDVFYQDFEDYCHENKLLQNDAVISGFIIKSKKGNVKKTFHEFLDFYKNTILKDMIDKPTKLTIDGDMKNKSYWSIEYNFKIEDIPCKLEVDILASEQDYIKDDKDRSYFKSPYQITPNEELTDPYFIYIFKIGSRAAKL